MIMTNLAAKQIQQRLDIARIAEESNRIEGIKRTTTEEIVALIEFTQLEVITIDNLIEYVQTVQPDARLRIAQGMNVSVGNHIPPAGGQGIAYKLEALLNAINLKWDNPLAIHRHHIEYELLHPFTDGNGRSGRALWLWMMIQQNKDISLGFLHTFYYQTLQAAQR